MKKKSNIRKALLFIVGVGLILFAVIPTPDDVTIISPILAFTFGIKLIVDAV